jgi:glycosyltransferase involved in cell wall biosynthesis
MVTSVDAMISSTASSSLVSVIMPFLDTPEAFLRQAVESVRAQTHRNWELLLVNDGSRPKISAVAHELVMSDPSRIRLLTHPDHARLGSSKSRNLGLAQAQGDYIALLDSDDVWEPAKLEEQLQLLADHPDAGMLYGNTLYWYSWSDRSGDEARDYLPRLGISSATLVAPPTMLRYSLQGRIAVPCTCSVIMRRDALPAEDWFEDEFVGMYDDQVLYAKFWTHAPVYVVDRCWDKYRRHPGSMNAHGDKSLPCFHARQAYLQWLRDYLERHRVMDRDVWRALAIERKVAKSRRLGSTFRTLRGYAWRLLPPIQ